MPPLPAPQRPVGYGSDLQWRLMAFIVPAAVVSVGVIVGLLLNAG